MKKQKLFKLLLLVLPLTSYSQKITFYKDVFDFGNIKQGEVTTTNFFFRNTGDKPLVITNVNASCGCTVGEYPIDPVLPGVCGVIKVTFTSAGKQGLQNKTCTVISNSVIDNSKVISIKGVVNAGEELKAEEKICSQFKVDQTAVNFGKIKDGEEKSVIIRIQNNDAVDLKLNYNAVSKNAGGDNLIVSFLPYEWREYKVSSKARSICIKPGESFALRVTASEKAGGRKDFSDNLVFTGNVPGSKLSIPVSGNF